MLKINYGMLVEEYFPIVYLLICILYIYFPFISVIITILAFLSLFKVKNEYNQTTLLKLGLVIALSGVFFTNLYIKSIPYANHIVRVLMFLNIIIIAGVNSFESFFMDILIRTGIIVTAFLTPYIDFEKTEGYMKKGIVSANTFVMIYIIVFTVQHLLDKDFKEHIELMVSSLLLSFIFHFLFNKCIEIRLLTLLILCIFEAFDIKNFMY